MTTHSATSPSRLRLPVRQAQAWRANFAKSEATVAGRVATLVSLMMVGLALWLVLFGLVLSGLTEHHQQQHLYTAFRTQLAEATAPTGGQIKDGAPVAIIDGAAGGVHGLVVVEGTTSSDLKNGPGHYPGTALPGQPGASTVFGRGTSYGGPFGSITSFAPGDKITATTAQGTFTYIVEDVRRSGDPLPGTLATGSGQLTLITSTSGGWASAWSDKQTVYVDAILSGKTVEAPSGTNSPRPADVLQKGDTSGIVVLVLWMQLLLIAGVAIVWGRARWGRSQAWLIGVPIVLGALWGATSCAWQLLPNVF